MPELPYLHKVHDYLMFHAEQNPGAPAVEWQEVVITYGELKMQVEACAEALICAGVEPGDRVAILATVCREYLVTFLATSMVGGIWLGLNPQYQQPELEHILGDAEPRILFAAPHFDTKDLHILATRLVTLCPSIHKCITIDEHDRPGWQCFDSFLGQVPDVGSATVLRQCMDLRRSEDPVALIYTSGTTGKPKGALLSHAGLIGRALTQNRIWPCTEIRVINPLPINHIGCLGFISIYALVGGGLQFLMRRFQPEAFIERLEEDRITMWIGLPVIFLMIMNHPRFRPDMLGHLEWAVWSGAAMPFALIRRLRQFGWRLGSSYGLTESSGSVCYAPYDLDEVRLSRTIGRATPAGEVRLAGSDGTPVPTGREGEIQVRPEWAMVSYHGHEAASRVARAPDGWVRTGDIGRADAEGNIELVGRLKEMFKSGGYNVYPREVELAIESHPAVAMCAIVPIPDERFQEVSIAYLELTHDAVLEIEELRRWCKEKMANYKIPKHFVVHNELPKLSMAKVDKLRLRELAAKFTATLSLPSGSAQFEGDSME